MAKGGKVGNGYYVSWFEDGEEQVEKFNGKELEEAKDFFDFIKREKFYYEKPKVVLTSMDNGKVIMGEEFAKGGKTRNLDEYDLSSEGGSKGFIDKSIKSSEHIIDILNKHLKKPLLKGEKESNRDFIRKSISDLKKEIAELKEERKKYANGGKMKNLDDKIGDVYDLLEQNKKTIDTTQNLLNNIYGKNITYQDRIKKVYAEGGEISIDDLVFVEPEDKEKFLSGGVILGTLAGAYVGYKIGRAKPQKKGFETEKKVASKVKSEAKKVTDSLKKKK